MRRKGTFRELKVWQKAIGLTKQIYLLTQSMPDTERFGLTMQMRRAAVSVPSNIAEGNARQTLREYLQFLAIARGSLAELETQLIIASELSMLHKTDKTMEPILEVARMLQALIDSLRRKQKGG